MIIITKYNEHPFFPIYFIGTLKTVHDYEYKNNRFIDKYSEWYL